MKVIHGMTQRIPHGVAYLIRVGGLVIASKSAALDRRRIVIGVVRIDPSEPVVQSPESLNHLCQTPSFGLIHRGEP